MTGSKPPPQRDDLATPQPAATVLSALRRGTAGRGRALVAGRGSDQCKGARDQLHHSTATLPTPTDGAYPHTPYLYRSAPSNCCLAAGGKAQPVLSKLVLAKPRSPCPLIASAL